MSSGHATRGEILTAFNKTHQKVLVKVEQLDRALTNFQFEGKSSQGRNLKRIRSVLKFFQEELIDHIELEEQIVFPFLESHIPKLELVIQVLRSEHEDLRRNLGDLQLFLNVLSDGKSQTTHSKIVHKILETGTYLIYLLRNHIRIEDKSVYEAVDRSLKFNEKKQLECQVRKSVKKCNLNAKIAIGRSKLATK